MCGLRIVFRKCVHSVCPQNKTLVLIYCLLHRLLRLVWSIIIVCVVVYCFSGKSKMFYPTPLSENLVCDSEQ